MSNCCDPNAPIVYKLKIGDQMTGFLGLEQAFMDVRELDLPDQEIPRKLLEIVGCRNYIPVCAEPAYKEALFAEYQKYIATTKLARRDGS
ncbi:MAG TPA: hypothetical protein DCK76_01600 [Desulfotomaculum sp.]|nr:MAG: hypothetical protein XD84_2014 [Desulfotomaculum sp. 46_80]HAG10100.1 hypothetical protein [Desulfotomaculum sp.]HBY04033.1 hypothetical protein [Desulfotomaculum sp.]